MTVAKHNFEPGAEDEVVRSAGVVEGAVLDGVRLPARGVAQLALVLLQDGAGDQPLSVVQVVARHDVLVLFLAQAKLALLRPIFVSAAAVAAGVRSALGHRQGSLLSQLLADSGPDLCKA